MALISTQAVTLAGLTPTYGAAAAGDTADVGYGLACRSCNSSKSARLLYPWRVSVLLNAYGRTLAAA